MTAIAVWMSRFGSAKKLGSASATVSRVFSGCSEALCGRSSLTPGMFANSAPGSPASSVAGIRGAFQALQPSADGLGDGLDVALPPSDRDHERHPRQEVSHVVLAEVDECEPERAGVRPSDRPC